MVLSNMFNSSTSMDSPSSNRCWSFPNVLACCWPSLDNRPISRYMEFCSLAIRWLNLPRTPPRWPANWFNSSFETKMGVGVLERARTSRPKSNLLVVLVFCGPGVWLLLWMMVSAPRSSRNRGFLLSWLVIVMCQVANTPGTSLCFIALVWRISDDAYRIDLGLSQISGISVSLLDVGYGMFQNSSGNS